MRKIGYSLILLVFVLQSSCSKSNKETPGRSDETGYWEKHIPFKTDYNTFTLPFSSRFNSIPEEKGRVALTEASGLAYSVKNPGKIWSHNDSGHANYLFLIDEHTAEVVARYSIGGTSNVDWEDIEICKGPVDGMPYLYIADTGDNDQKRGTYSVYRFEEPKYNPVSDYGQTITVNVPVDRIQFRYPDVNHNCESMMVDPLTKDVYLVTKSGVVSHLYVLPYPQKLNEIFTAFKAGDFSFREASAATCSHDGQKVLIKNRAEIYYWERNNDEKVVDMLARTPVKAPYIGEQQGEAICFDIQNNYYTLSEKASATEYPLLYKYIFKN